MREEAAPVRTGAGGATRAQLLKRGGIAAAGGVGGAAVVAHAAGVLAAPSAAQERQVLNLLLLVERTEHAFYRQALRQAGLEGDMRQYAEVVVDHERAHQQALEHALGGAAAKPPAFDFGDAVRSPDAFAATAAELEDVAVAAYNGQAGNVGEDAFLLAARIVSVEARHAAWIRSIAGRDPAPDAVDRPRTAKQIRSALKEIGVQA